MSDPNCDPTEPLEGTFVSEETGREEHGAISADPADPADLSYAELGFEPVTSVTGADPVDATPGRDRAKRDRRAVKTRSDEHVAARGPRRRRTVLRRKLGAAGVLFSALFVVGGGYAAFASSSGAADSAQTTVSISQGRQLYDITCIACHGANLQGVTGRGPSLIGVGAAATYFQVGTGRMPAAGQGASIQRKTPKYNDEQTRAIAAFVQSIGGGPAIPSGKLRGTTSSIAEGGELFSVNCASCHGITGKGAPLSAGKVAPSLNDATDLEIWTAMLSGPESMPVFGNNQITPEQKQAIVGYVQTLKASSDPGGSGIDRIGPVSEAIVVWVAGVGLLMVAILWIGARSQ